MLVAFIFIKASAQNGNNVFNDSVIHTLYIETDMPDWFSVLDDDYKQNLIDPVLYPQIYRNCNVVWDGIAISNCGFRQKGNASNLFTSFGRKKPLKISFDEFTNQNLDGLKKINLNNFTNDPSLLHDVISNKLFRDCGINAPRTSYVKVWIDKEYIGLYLTIENVDKTFLKKHYGGASNDGNLYKTDRGAKVFLNWLGQDASAYEDAGLKLNTNESINDWTKLISFIDLINNYTEDDFRQKFESNFDIHQYIKILAIEKCLRSWDSYWGGGNNFFIYEHPDGMMRWIPWDMNETFQDVKILSGTSVLDGYLVPANRFDERPLLKRIFEIEDYKNEYLNYCCELIQTKFTLSNLGQYILNQHNLVDATYQTDPNRYNGYDAYKYSLTQDNTDDVTISKSAFELRIKYPGIYPFIQSQREWVVKQLKGWDQSCNIEDKSVYTLSVFPNPTINDINVVNLNSEFEYAQFKLVDFTGKLVKVTDYDVMSGASYNLLLENIPAGIYVLLKQSVDGKLGKAKIVITR